MEDQGYTEQLPVFVFVTVLKIFKKVCIDVSAEAAFTLYYQLPTNQVSSRVLLLIDFIIADGAFR